MTTTKERPILFSGEMVRAILDGRKSQTRRPVKVPYWVKSGPHKDQWGNFFWISNEAPNYCRTWPYREVPTGENPGQCCPYGAPGDLLRVKEKWRPVGFNEDIRYPFVTQSIQYEADNSVRRFNAPGFADMPVPMFNKKDSEDGWRLARILPRWASRITLRITDVRVERVQEITEEDARAEGVQSAGFGMVDDHVIQFAADWQRLYAAKGLGWDENPWVWCVSFEMVTP